MTRVNCSGSEELDFRLVFGEEAQQQLGPAGGEPDDITPYYTQSLVHQAPGQDLQSHHASLTSPAPLQASRGYQQPLQGYEVQGTQYGSLGHPKAFDCPSIQITSIAPNCHLEAGSSQDVVRARGRDGEGPGPERSWSRDHLHLSLDPCYRDSALSHSPCSSLSSRSWLSDVSSCESFSHIYDDVEAELNEAASRFTLGSPLPSPGCGGGAFGVEIWQQRYQHPLGSAHPSLSPRQSPRQSPCASPRQSPRNSVTDDNWLNPRPASRSSSRPTSPGGKRRHSSADVHARSPSPHRSPSPTPRHSPRGSVTEDTWGGGGPPGALGPLLYGYPELDVPSKTRKTTGAHLALQPGQGEAMQEGVGSGLPFLDSPDEGCVGGLNQDGLAELFLSVPSHFTWNKPKTGSTPLFRLPSLPPLDWHLPSQHGQCELKIEVQPRAHHRAHYETEGSRGAVKAASGGHPIVKLLGYSEKPVNLQVFIGTADDRCLRPHAFYQVHRVTGKTVSTACQESLVNSTKVLEIPLLPENNMSTSIDCAGILKLRNSDIELRKGETDIGRKNTRVRMAFRVRVPQPDGTVLCLQAASIPIECSQRSAQELPQVESFSPVSSPVSGGEELTITGSNISLDTKVIFVEKGLDGRTQWEVDAKVMREKSSGSTLVVEVPAYHSKTVNSSVQVQFYVSNGKRKRSQTRSFTYLGAAALRYPPAGAGDATAITKHVKQEHGDADYITHNPPGRYPACDQLPSPDRAFTGDASFYGSSGQPVPCEQFPQLVYTPLGSSPHQYPPQLHGYVPGIVPGMGQQRTSPIHTVSPTPASRSRPSYQPTVQYSVPYDSQSGSAASQASQPLLVQVKMAAQASSQRDGSMHLGHTQPQLSSSAPQTTERQARGHASTQLYSLGYHVSLSDLGDLRGLSDQDLAYRSTRDVFASYSPTPAVTAASSATPPVSSGGSPRHQAPSLSPSRGSLACVDPQKHSQAPHSIFSHSGERVSVKQEPEERLSLGTVGLQEITLDDVNEVIDRDISELGGVTAEAGQPGPDHYGWDQSSSEASLTFCGLH